MNFVGTGVEEAEKDRQKNLFRVEIELWKLNNIKIKQSAQDGVLGEVGGFADEKNQSIQVDQVIFETVTDVWEILGDKVNEKIALRIRRIMAEGRHGENKAHL